MELVSIIMPTYKGTATLERAIESVLAQSYKTYELIIVDDNGLGTPEQIKTKGIVDQYIYNPKLIYVTHENNINGSAARNTGFTYSKGDYIALLDDDDIFLPQKIRKQVEVLREKDETYGLCYTSFENFFPNGRRRVVNSSKEGDLCFDLLANNIEILSSTLLVRREAWLNVNGFDETFQRAQDQEFLTRLLVKYNATVVTDICMQRYVLGRNSPKTVENSVMLRKNFINKMEHIIKTFDNKDQKKIHSQNNLIYAKRYFKAKKITKFIKYLLKSKTPIKGMIYLANDYFMYIKTK